jgi:uncharacterized protein (TIGR03083 family)
MKEAVPDDAIAAPLDGRAVLAAAEECARLLSPAVHSDWSTPVPELEFTVASVVAHAAEGPLWYALDIWGGPGDNGAFELGVRPDAANDRLLASLLSAARTCAASIDAAPPDTRGFHPAGAADPEGFAALACDELLVHGRDAAIGLGLPFSPAPDLAARVLARLFPWHRTSEDPWPTLLWANGRIELPGLPRQREWRWHPAPLSEWDGRPGLGRGAS